MTDVFISYAREDSAIASRLAEGRRSSGFAVWIDKNDIGPGRHFDREIERAIVAAKAVVVLWTSAAVNSNWVRAEAHLASDANKLIPLRIEQLEPPLSVRQLQNIDFFAWDGSTSAECFQRLSSAITAINAGVMSVSTLMPIKSSEFGRLMEVAGFRFSSRDAERRFGQFYLDRYFHTFRVSLVAITIAYALYSVGDMMNRFGSVDANFFRSLIAAPVLLAFVALTYLPFARRHWRLLATSAVLGGLVLLVLTVNAQNLSPNPPPFEGIYQYHGGAVVAHFILAACLIAIVPLRLFESAVCALALVMLVLGLDHLVDVIPYDHYLAQTQAFAAGTLIVLGSWLRERIARRWFRETGN